jgi:inhibitor of cysteine peptidase
MKVIDVTDNDTEIRLADGERFEVRLPENASTGYQWSVARVSDPVELLDDDFVAPGTMVPGAPGQHHFTFVARGAGSGRVVLELRRSWEQQAEPEQRFEVGVSTDRRAGSALEDSADERGIEDLDDEI